MERHPVDLMHARIYPWRRGHPPFDVAQAQPARERAALRQDHVQQGEGVGRQVQQTLASRKAHALRPKDGHEGRIAVLHYVARTVAYGCGTSCRRAAVRRRPHRIGFSHAVDCAPAAQEARLSGPGGAHGFQEGARVVVEDEHLGRGPEGRKRPGRCRRARGHWLQRVDRLSSPGVRARVFAEIVLQTRSAGRAACQPAFPRGSLGNDAS